MLLSVRDLKVGLVRDGRPVELVRGINLDVGEGEIVALVGESGSGKSLTALSIPRILPPPLQTLGGKIVFNGVDLTQLSEKQIHALRGREIGVIFQDPLTALNPTLTIGTQLVNIVLSRSTCSKAEAREPAIRALRSVGIASPEHRMNVYPHQMSGGMRQRVSIAMAMLGKPKLILADEPTTALDVTVQARIVALLRSIRESTNVAIVFISHNLDLVAEFCDRVVVLYGGRIMEQGSSAQIINTPRHPYTKALLECIPRLVGAPGPLRVIQGLPPSNPGSIPGCPFAARCARALPVCHSSFPEATQEGRDHAFYCWNPEPVERGLRVA